MFSEIATVLVIAAHPDDEALGCGGTMARLAGQGATVHVAFLADGVGARSSDGTAEVGGLRARQDAARAACAALGAEEPSFGDLPDNRLDTRSRLEVIQTVEGFIESLRPETVFTHHAGDVNIDHRRVHEAVVTACRSQPGHPVRRLLFFEVASSTEWQPPGSGAPFQPHVFVNISATLARKQQALRAYAEELRCWPHPRSLEGVEYLARWRGASAGMEAAEAFMLGRELL